MENKLITITSIVFYLMILSVIGMGFEMIYSSINDTHFIGYSILCFITFLAIWLILLTVLASKYKDDKNE